MRNWHVLFTFLLVSSCIMPIKVHAESAGTQTVLPKEETFSFHKHEQRVAPPTPAPRTIPVYRSTTALPLFTKQLGLTPEQAPLPFTIMLFGNYFQGTIVPSNFEGTLKTKVPFLGDMTIDLGNLGVTVENVKQRFLTGGVRFGVNVLPFFSVYGLFASSNGTTQTAMKMPGIPSTPFSMDFDATTGGLGATITIGGEVFFASLDANYSFTSVESIDIIVHTINVSTRVGMHQRKGDESIAMWVGANYMDNVGGSGKLGAALSVERLNDLMDLDSILPGIGNLIGNRPAQIFWLVDQKPLSVISAIVGFKYSPFQNFDFITELTFIDRFTATVSIGYNF